jgi:hypothetical protein
MRSDKSSWPQVDGFLRIPRPPTPTPTCPTTIPPPHPIDTPPTECSPMAGLFGLLPSPGTVSQRRDSDSPSGLRPLPLPWGKYATRATVPLHADRGTSIRSAAAATPTLHPRSAFDRPTRTLRPPGTGAGGDLLLHLFLFTSVADRVPGIQPGRAACSQRARRADYSAHACPLPASLSRMKPPYGSSAMIAFPHFGQCFVAMTIPTMFGVIVLWQAGHFGRWRFCVRKIAANNNAIFTPNPTSDTVCQRMPIPKDRKDSASHRAILALKTSSTNRGAMLTYTAVQYRRVDLLMDSTGNMVTSSQMRWWIQDLGNGSKHSIPRYSPAPAPKRSYLTTIPFPHPTDTPLTERSSMAGLLPGFPPAR